MLDNIIPLPKTKAGLFFRNEKHRVVRERLTSYGSIAIIISNNNFIITAWFSDNRSYKFINCGYDVKLINELWRDLI